MKSFKRGDVASSNGRFFVVESVAGEELHVTDLLTFHSITLPVKGSKNEPHSPSPRKCLSCHGTPFIGKHPQREVNKWRAFCVCNGPAVWAETKGHAILIWNKSNGLDATGTHSPITMQETLISLITECSDVVVYRTMNNESFTGIQMADEFRNRTDIGLQYGSDLLRVSRDLLSRMSKKG